MQISAAASGAGQISAAAAAAAAGGVEEQSPDASGHTIPSAAGIESLNLLEP